MEDLPALTEVVRRVIGAKVTQPHLVEDLTQETLLHVAAADGLSIDERQAYAIVTARHLVIDHARRGAALDRHLHRLVDTDDHRGPEQHALQREETAALAEALQQLPPGDRAMLVRHEVDGDSLEELAADTRSSARTVANRLARSRATLRVDFVVALRRVSLPTTACRPVLLAMSSGDRRRQHQLHAHRHLERCRVCAELARPISARRRGIAAWLIVPVAEAIRRLGQSLRRSHWTQAATATVIAAVAITGFTITRTDPAPNRALRSQPAAPATAASEVTPSPTTVPVQPTCPPAAPLDRQPSPPIGCDIAPTTFTVSDVPADEGFWARDPTGAFVWIQLAGAGESPFDITTGITLTAAGTVTDPAGLPEIAADRRTVARGFILTVRYEDLTSD